MDAATPKPMHGHEHHFWDGLAYYFIAGALTVHPIDWGNLTKAAIQLLLALGTFMLGTDRMIHRFREWRQSHRRERRLRRVKARRHAAHARG